MGGEWPIPCSKQFRGVYRPDDARARKHRIPEMIAKSVVLDEDVVIHHPDLVNLYGCRVGKGSRIGTFVEVQRGAVIGRQCKISSHTFICEGVTLEEGVF